MKENHTVLVVIRGGINKGKRPSLLRGRFTQLMFLFESMSQKVGAYDLCLFDLNKCYL